MNDDKKSEITIYCDWNGFWFGALLFCGAFSVFGGTKWILECCRLIGGY